MAINSVFSLWKCECTDFFRLHTLCSKQTVVFILDDILYFVGDAKSRKKTIFKLMAPSEVINAASDKVFLLLSTIRSLVA